MTDNKIDLDSIPHPRDCHRVPVGATIPAGTPHWAAYPGGQLEWRPVGFNFNLTVRPNNLDFFLTAEPIPAPTPEDSPIIASGAGDGGAFHDALMWCDHKGNWWGLDASGHHIVVTDADYITEWSPAVVTATGHGVMDDRDKRDRVLLHGERVVWRDDLRTWVTSDGEHYGTLAAVAANWGEGLRFEEPGRL